MIQTVLTAIATFIATDVDNFFILLILFALERYRLKAPGVILGQYLGTTLLFAVSLITAFGIHFIPQTWIVGLLGLIPIGLGLKLLFKSETEVSEEVLESVNKYKGVVMSLTFLTLASGFDNLGLYIPLFASLDPFDTFVTITVIFIMLALMNLVSYKIAGISQIRELVERVERILVPIIFIAIGWMVLVENGTIKKILSLF